MADTESEEYPKWWTNFLNDAIEQGKIEGREAVAVNLIRLGRMSLIDVSVACDIPIKRIQELIAQA
ncbi:MAG: hypothetical protein IJP89_09545 [Synergistaceae bacterium]|nr:hypothetical protein [Synergistaceae bacterium]MBR0256487.1 hypothetical protein [Synergistaceae bacterium]